MNILNTNALLLLTTLIFNFSYSQEIDLPKKLMTSVDIAASYIPQTIIAAAKQMPEEYYTFRPTKESRSFGELMAHIAESNFEMVAIAKMENNPMLKVNPNKTEVLKALITSFDYLANARKNMTKEQKERLVKFMSNDQPASNVLDFSIFHSLQHYGNVIVYMRLKGLIPPSSQEDSGNDPTRQ
jgi:uncharacterized damage-inducible protein DinB